MIVDNALYRDGIRVQLGCDISDLTTVRSSTTDGDFVWIGLHEPTTDEIDRVAKVFDLHGLSVEDALHAHQRPKLERYDGMLFLVLKTLWYVDEYDAVETGQISLFVGPDYVVSVRYGEGVELHSSRMHLEEHSKILEHGPDRGRLQDLRLGADLHPQA